MNRQAEFEAMQDEFFSDNLERGCRRHPHVVTSNGMFDAPCGECEAEMDMAQYECEAV